MNLSPSKVLEKSWKFVSEKGYEPCAYCLPVVHNFKVGADVGN